MPSSEAREKTSGLLLDSTESIADLMRSVAHPARIRIMAMAMRNDGDFRAMAERTGLSKTAIANHLAQLVVAGLVQKAARGEYVLTRDGLDLLSSAARTYRNSARRAREEREMVRMSYSSSGSSDTEDDGQVLESDPRFVPCWLSYIGAMTGSLRAMGIKCLPSDVGGHSGYSFIVNVAAGETCPSGPTALHIKTFRELLRGTENLGWKIDAFVHPHGYPASKMGPTAKELELVRAIFERIKRDIDRHQRPVILWGLGAPEYGIVRGYKGDSYLVSTFRSSSNPTVEEDPVRFSDLRAPGCIDVLSFKGKFRTSPKANLAESLERAFRFASGDMNIASNYIAGSGAFEEWAGILDNPSNEGQNYMGNSYVGACVQEGMALSARFLRAAAKRVPATKSMRLASASGSYARCARQMAEFTKLFPFAFEGNMPLARRRRGSIILRDVMRTHVKATKALGGAV